MKAVALWTFLALGLALGACQPRATPPPEDAAPEAPAPAASAAVLLFEDNLDFAATEPFAGGRDVYRDEVDGLARRLRDQGIDAQALLVPLDAFALRDLAPFSAVVVVDTFVINPPARAVLEAFVRRGGTLVGVCEVGRFPGEWAQPWPFGELFGLATRVTDRYGTGVANGPAGFYQFADVTDPSSDLLRGLGARLDWGPLAQHAWATDPAGAQVLATFPRYLASADTNAGDVTVTGALPALTVHAYGEGRAVFLATLPPARTFDGWDASPDALQVIANAVRIAGPPRGGLDAPSPAVELTLGYNQVAYAPDWPKRVVVRVRGGDGAHAPPGTYQVRGPDGGTVREGALEAWPAPLWRTQFLYAEVTDLAAPGDYVVRVEVQGAEAAEAPLRIVADPAGTVLADASQSFFEQMRCGESCHRTDPVPGGYHDASGDWGVRMWSMPHALWALARYVEAHPADERFRYELERTAMWMWRMRGPDGAPYAATKSPIDVSPIEQRPPADTTQRELEQRFSFEYTATYAAALARAIKPVSEHVSGNLARELQAAAERAYLRIRDEPVDTTKDLGNRLWAAMELHRATQVPEFLVHAERDAKRLLPRQLGPGRVVDGDVHGDFFADARLTTFSEQQWKRFHGIGIYLGLIEFARAVPDGTLKTDVGVVLDRFTRGFLEGMSSLTPYGQMALALEPAAPPRRRQDGRGFEAPERFKVFHFSHREAWVRDHGLNADLLAMATVALERRRDTGDAGLRDLAVRQINWVLGANPLGYCMLDGYGVAPAPGMDPNLGTGPIRGAIPNGIIGRGVDNVPVWGTTWDSREYWLPQNVYLLSTLALLDPARR